MSPKWEMLRSRSEQTTRTAKAIVDAERSARTAKIARLREARLRAASEPISADPNRAGDRPTGKE
jgi:hypothetical protein